MPAIEMRLADCQVFPHKIWIIFYITVYIDRSMNYLLGNTVLYLPKYLAQYDFNFNHIQM